MGYTNLVKALCQQSDPPSAQVGQYGGKMCSSSLINLNAWPPAIQTKELLLLSSQVSGQGKDSVKPILSCSLSQKCQNAPWDTSLTTMRVLFSASLCLSKLMNSSLKYKVLWLIEVGMSPLMICGPISGGTLSFLAGRHMSFWLVNLKLPLFSPGSGSQVIWVLISSFFGFF